MNNTQKLFWRILGRFKLQPLAINIKNHEFMYVISTQNTHFIFKVALCFISTILLSVQFLKAERNLLIEGNKAELTIQINSSACESTKDTHQIIWSTGHNSKTISVTKSGTYIVSVEDCTGQTAIDTIAIEFISDADQHQILNNGSLESYTYMESNLSILEIIDLERALRKYTAKR